MNNFDVIDQNANANNIVTGASIDHIRRSAGWMKFLAILMLISAGFMVLGGLAIMTMGASLFANLPNAQALGGVPFSFMGLLYIVLSLIIIFPGLYLYRAASNYQQYVNSENAIDLELALEQQAKYWRFHGITAAIGIGFYAIIIVISILGGIAAALAH